MRSDQAVVASVWSGVDPVEAMGTQRLAGACRKYERPAKSRGGLMTLPSDRKSSHE